MKHATLLFFLLSLLVYVAGFQMQALALMGVAAVAALIGAGGDE